MKGRIVCLKGFSRERIGISASIRIGRDRQIGVLEIHGAKELRMVEELDEYFLVSRWGDGIDGHFHRFVRAGPTGCNDSDVVGTSSLFCELYE